MFGRKARRIEELEEKVADLLRENRTLKTELERSRNLEKVTPKPTFSNGKRQKPTLPPKKKKPSAIIGRGSSVHHSSDDGPGLGTGLVAGMIIGNMLSDDNHENHHSEPDNDFSGGGGDFGGGSD